ncbi:MerR family transcriptional regulator [Luteimicrobium subarcticum]|uniref:MerR-like DNA binding protein n=1 Tax=Luteimicrobium subarcticum TaxID=620910 RepID=A0A2M8W3S4_9MICO|nr:MerR family transcriptional regulator [Luteimicrobium subarcticum]PJI85581.1 MerR-like DNA binding protein [Luteimicrobium subarcticum]
MSAPATARGDGPDDAPTTQPWPRGASRAATMRISDVLRALQGEFPSLSPSKLRFLEDQGLVVPVRTAAGYRQYSAADVERIRFVLAEQRDRYLPLKVIKDHLAALDSGAENRSPVPGGVVRGGSASPGDRPTVRSLAALAAVEPAVVQELVTTGVVRPGPDGEVDAWAVEITRVVAALGEFGIEPRHLRPLRASADRHVALVDQVVAPWRSQQSPAARTRAEELATEVADLCTRLHAALVRQGVADLTP